MAKFEATLSDINGLLSAFDKILQDLLSGVKGLKDAHEDELRDAEERLNNVSLELEGKLEGTYQYLKERDELLNRQFADSSDDGILAEQTRVRGLIGGLE